jgi:Skp family chaperone for outer membrane proteins
MAVAKANNSDVIPVSIVREMFQDTNKAIKELAEKVDSLKDNQRDRSDEMRKNFEDKLAKLRQDSKEENDSARSELKKEIDQIRAETKKEIDTLTKASQHNHDDNIANKKDIALWTKILGVLGLTALGASMTALMKMLLK